MAALTRRRVVAGLATSGLLAGAAAARPAATALRTTFLDVMRDPDTVTAYDGLDRPRKLARGASGWTAPGIRVRTEPLERTVAVYLYAPGSAPTHVHFRWNMRVSESLLVLGDTWERSYGDLRWMYLVPERVMPWYFLTTDSDGVHGYGVRTAAGSLCFWQLDPDGVSLWVNACNGGSAASLGERELLAASIVTRRGEFAEDAGLAARAFCGMMCEKPRAAPRFLYGTNDWYYAYGKNTAQGILGDAELIASVTPSSAERPFTVIDDGWKNAAAFPDMAALARAIRERGVRPGLWIRPLQAPPQTPDNLLLPKERMSWDDPAYDPTIPEALDHTLDKVRQATNWGYELIKHDYTTYEIFGQWGFQMNASPAQPSWSFHDRSKTNAEIIRDFYTAIRRTAGERTVILGCNTIGHLSAGLFEAQRIGDDTSGQIWERTRRNGVNALAYRIAQHRTFFIADADCVPITTLTPWSFNRQWLDLVARSGTALFVSPQPAAVGAEQRAALRSAIETLLSAENNARPIDFRTSTPATYRFGDVERKYDWYEGTGAWPYGI
jgi:alpha-galactosidase